MIFKAFRLGAGGQQLPRVKLAKRKERIDFVESKIKKKIRTKQTKLLDKSGCQNIIIK